MCGWKAHWLADWLGKLPNYWTDIDDFWHLNYILVWEVTLHIIFKNLKKGQHCKHIYAYTDGVLPLIPLSFIIVTDLCVFIGGVNYMGVHYKGGLLYEVPILL